MTRYVEERRDAFGVEPVCRVLGVAVSTFCAPVLDFAASRSTGLNNDVATLPSVSLTCLPGGVTACRTSMN